MDTQKRDTSTASQGTDSTPQSPIDPRRRVYIPIEKRDVRGFWHFQTHDKVQYVRHPQTGEIRRVRRAND